MNDVLVWKFSWYLCIVYVGPVLQGIFPYIKNAPSQRLLSGWLGSLWSLIAHHPREAHHSGSISNAAGEGRTLPAGTQLRNKITLIHVGAVLQGISPYIKNAPSQRLLSGWLGSLWSLIAHHTREAHHSGSIHTAAGEGRAQTAGTQLADGLWFHTPNIAYVHGVLLWK